MPSKPDTARSLSTAQNSPTITFFDHIAAHQQFSTNLSLRPTPKSPPRPAYLLITDGQRTTPLAIFEVGKAAAERAIDFFNMATNGDFSDESLPGSPNLDATNARDFDDQEPLDEKPLKSAMKKTAAPPPEAPKRPWLPEQPDPATLDLSTLSPLSPEVIARQATQNIGTIGKTAIDCMYQFAAP